MHQIETALESSHQEVWFHFAYPTANVLPFGPQLTEETSNTDAFCPVGAISLAFSTFAFLTGSALPFFLIGNDSQSSSPTSSKSSNHFSSAASGSPIYFGFYSMNSKLVLSPYKVQISLLLSLTTFSNSSKVLLFLIFDSSIKESFGYTEFKKSNNCWSNYSSVGSKSSSKSAYLIKRSVCISKFADSFPVLV